MKLPSPQQKRGGPTWSLCSLTAMFLKRGTAVPRSTFGKLTLPLNIFGSSLSICGRICSRTMSSKTTHSRPRLLQSGSEEVVDAGPQDGQQAVQPLALLYSKCH